MNACDIRSLFKRAKFCKDILNTFKEISEWVGWGRVGKGKGKIWLVRVEPGGVGLGWGVVGWGGVGWGGVG